MKIAVVGGGTWGTTLAHLWANNAPTTLWARNTHDVEAINTRQENPRFLPGHRLHEQLRATDDLDEAVADADVVAVSVPTTAFAAIVRKLHRHVAADTPVISLTKGIDAHTGCRMTELISRHLPGRPFGLLTGPNLASEMMLGAPAAAILAMNDADLARPLQQVFSAERFRVHVHADVIGAEIGGAVKNIIAIAVGIADGMKSGDNVRSALITRGLEEITRLGVAVGGQRDTFAGLAGLGDLIATSTSDKSRNRRVGLALGAGQELASVIAGMDHQVAEGIASAQAVAALSRRVGVETPMCEEIRAVVVDGRSAAVAYQNLLRVL